MDDGQNFATHGGPRYSQYDPSPRTVVFSNYFVELAAFGLPGTGFAGDDLNPPDKALVLCVDEKNQVQALERTQPVLPMGLGYVEGVTHDYYRHGTTTLFAALNVLDGSVISQCKPRHRHQEFLAFLNHLDRNLRRPGGASDRRQLRHPQTCQGQSLARTPAALSHPLHARLREAVGEVE